MFDMYSANAYDWINNIGSVTASVMMLKVLKLAVKVALLFLAGYAVNRIVIKILKRVLEKSSLDRALHAFIVNGVNVLTWIIIGITILGTLGIQTSTFVAILGAAGAAVALALKDSLGNISGGIIIIVTKPFKNGDVIDVAGSTGIVEKTDLLYTYLKTFDNKVISIPNGQLTTSVLVNYSRLDTRRVDCSFNVGYEDDIAKVKEVLLTVAGQNPMIFSEPAPFVGVSNHGDSCINIDLRVWCDTVNYWEVKYYLEENVKIAFDVNGITIPYPQIAVHNIK